MITVRGVAMMSKRPREKRSHKEHIQWFGLARLNYISACGKHAFVTVDNAIAQRKTNLRAMANRIVRHDRAIMICEGYRP